MISNSGASDVHLRPGPFYDYRQTSFEVLGGICNRRPGQLLDLERKIIERTNEVKELRYSLALGWYAEKQLGTGTTTLGIVDEVLLAEEAEAQEAPSLGREAFTEHHMGRITEMVNKLVDDLLKVAYTRSEAEAPGTNPAPESLDSADTLIRLLRSDGYPRYTFAQLNPGQVITTRAQMDKLNKEILSKFHAPYRVRNVAKICYNLLVCPFPPSMETYNTLIWGFTQLGEHELAWVVVESFLYHSHLKPTQGTMLCLLQHFRLKRDILGFFEIIKRMIGKDPRGIGLMRKKATDPVGKFFLLRQAAGSADDVALIDNYLVVRAKLSRPVLETITEGLIDFGMLQQAAKVVVVCLNQGFVMKSNILSRLLHACIEILDRAAATYIIQGFLAHINQATSLIDQLSTSLARKIRRVLCIWHVKSPFTIRDRLANSGWDEPPEQAFDYLTAALWIRETITCVNVVNHGLERAIKALQRKRNPLHLRLDLAITILDHATKRQNHDSARAADIMWLGKVDWVQQQIHETELLIGSAEYMIVNALTKKLTPKGMRTWTHFQPHVPIAQRIKLHREANRKGTFLHECAQVFSTKRELDFQLKVTLMEALPDEWVDMLWEKRNVNGDLGLDATMIYFKKWLRRLINERMWGEAAQQIEEEFDDAEGALETRKWEGSKFPRLPEPLREDEVVGKVEVEDEAEVIQEVEGKKKNKNKNKNKKGRGDDEYEPEKFMDAAEFQAQMAAVAAGEREKLRVGTGKEKD